MTKLKTWLNAKEEVSKGEVNDSPSQTVPDMVMSLAQLLEKHSRGHAVPVHEGTYSDDDYTDYENLDMAEKYELARSNAEFIQNTRADLQNRKDAKAKQQADAEKAELEELRKLKKDAKSDPEHKQK